jgi:hypothetical protein
MKKSQLRNIIKESIKELMTEQSGSGGYTKYNVRSCNGGSTYGGLCLPSSANAQIGDVVTYPTAPPNGTPRNYFIREILGSCNASLYNFQNQPFITSSTNCPRCCSMSQWQQYGSNFGGACTTNQTGGSCTGGQAPSCPGWSGYSNWESNFTSLPNFTSSNPNQPCQFLCQRNTQWSAQISTVGPQWAAQLQCKIDKVQDLMQTHNCASSNAPAC